MVKCLLLTFVFLLFQPARAGYFEISASGSYRKTTYDKDNYYEYRSATGSIAYYFWEMSALELSYTRAITNEQKTDYESRGFIEMYGADLIFTMGGKQSLFQPYIKFGAAYQIKESSYKLVNQDAVELEPIKGVSPSAGVGFKLIFAKNFALKFGIDVWSSPLNEEESTYDYAGRAGISWIF